MATDELILDETADPLILDETSTDLLILEILVAADFVESERPFRELVGVTSLYQKIEGVSGYYITINGVFSTHQRIPGGQSIYRPIEGVTTTYIRLPGERTVFLPLEGVAGEFIRVPGKPNERVISGETSQYKQLVASHEYKQLEGVTSTYARLEGG